MANCVVCNKPIPEARVKFFEDQGKECETCANCSEDVPYSAVHYSGGTAGSMKNCGFNAVKNPGKGSLIHAHNGSRKYRAFGCKTASDNRSQKYWDNKQR